MRGAKIRDDKTDTHLTAFPDMIDATLVPLVNRALTPLARALVARGVDADRVTLIGFTLGLLAVPAIIAGYWWVALVLILLNRAADGLDGVVARLTEPTDRGAFLDIGLDFAFYALVPLGFALHDPTTNALPAAVLIASFVGTGSSFLAFAVIAAKHGDTAPEYPTKGIYYLGGLTEGFETILLFIIMCLAPAAFPTLAYIYAVACLVTTVLRWRQGWIAFGAKT